MEIDGSVKFSPSKLAAFQDCPRRYCFRYIDRIKADAQSVEAFLGTCVHGAFEALYEGLQHGKTPTEAECVAEFDRAWEAGWSDKITIVDSRFAPADWREVGRQCVVNYYRAESPFTKDSTVAVERRVSFPLAASGGAYVIEGFIDRLALGPDGAFEIHDYKTGRSLPTQADVDSDWQLAIYDIAVREAWPDTREVRLCWHYVRHGKTLVSRRTPEQREALKADIARLIAAIKAEREFPARKSALCDWCEYKPICPVWKHPEQVAHLPPAARGKDEGVRLVDELARLSDDKRTLRQRIAALERDQEAVESALLEFAQAGGFEAVAGSAAEAVISRKEELRFPTKTAAPEQHAALEAALRASPLWPEVSQLDAHRLAEGYKRKAWPSDWLSIAEDMIGRFAKRVKESSVRLHRRRDEQDD